MKKRIRKCLREWLGVDEVIKYADGIQFGMNANIDQLRSELIGRIEDLESAYPDYNKAKEKAEENKAQQIVPGFVPWSQRKRRAEAAMRRKADTK